MNHADETEWITEAVRRSYRDAEVPWPPRTAGPVPLNAIISTYNLAHEEVAGLNHAAASACLRRWEVHWEDIPEPDPSLAGFLYANDLGGYLFVRRGDGVTRRRFTAAHELGHYRLHLAPELARRGPGDEGMVETDADVSEADGAPLAAMERQANRFAAELLMPEGVCRDLADRYASKYGKVPRFLIHQIACDLLVSREAIAWRLYTLRLIDEMPRWLAGQRDEEVARREDVLRRDASGPRGWEMGLEFLSEHGASRVRPYPDQPELDLPDQADGGEGESADEQVDHDYEYEGKPWRPIAVDRAGVDWVEAPRRFVDGCHVGHTIAWLRDAQSHPVPLMLAEIGGVCMDRDGRDLRRSFQVVERVVALAIDPFPWHEVEDFAIALADSGFRLLPVSLSKVEGQEERVASFDFEVMRKKAQNRSNAEMEVLEEVALCQHAEIPTVVDGRLEPRINSSKGLQLCPIVGVIKQQRKGYLHPDGWRAYYRLEPAHRTPAFLIKGGLTKKTIPVVSWYLKLDGARGALPNWGVVRVEVAEAYFERVGRDFGQVDRLSHALYQMRCRLAVYRRGPVSLEPIVRAEESLRSLFSPPSWLAQHFYRLTGL